MYSRLADLLACPECRHPDLELAAAVRDGDVIVDGIFTCRACHREYPVIAGVPRMLPDRLRASLRRYHPEFFARYRVTLPADEENSAVARTLDFFTMQRPELHDVQLAPAFTGYLERNLDLRIPGARALRGKLGLDAGCGEGRYSYVLSRYGAEVVGMDLGNSVDFAYRRFQGHGNVHVVQASIYQPPFRVGVFDFVMSIGVLHHLPDPRAGFNALVPLLAPGGAMHIWVYGLENMSRMYRLSHLTPLRALTSRLSPRSTYLLSVPIALALEALLFVPTRLLQRSARLRGRIDEQVREIADLPFSVVVAEVHDRIGAPVTHFLGADELLDWYRQAGLDQVGVQVTPGGRGWSARGRIPAGLAASAS